MARLRYTSLGSGSEGNGLVVEAAGDRGPILVDCGFGVRDLERRLAARAIDATELQALLVTHEHADHVGGAFRVARRFGIPLYASHGTISAAVRAYGEVQLRGVDVRIVCSHTAFRIGELEVHPFPVPHDAREPTQFAFTAHGARLGVLTDVGSATSCIVDMLSGCNGLVLEFNHDDALLAGSDYPDALKRRIAGPYGHLSNAAAAALLAALDRSRLARLHAAHLSRQNNQAELVRAAIDTVLADADVDVVVATQDGGFEWAEL